MTVPPRALPLFVCHANCCRSVLAAHLYRQLGDAALSAGLERGEQIAPRALDLLRAWGIDASDHRPAQLDRATCDRASAIFVMAAPYARRLLSEYGEDLAPRTYLFADPFTRPTSIGERQFTVPDPSFDERPVEELTVEFAWLRERVRQIRDALRGEGPPLVPASAYLDVLARVDPHGH